MKTITRITLVLVIIGAVNWGLIGLFQFDLVAALFGGQDAGLARVVYTLVGLSGLWCISLLFRDVEEQGDERTPTPRAGNMAYGTELSEELDAEHSTERKE